LLCRSSKS